MSNYKLYQLISYNCHRKMKISIKCFVLGICIIQATSSLASSEEAKGSDGEKESSTGMTLHL